MKMMSKRKAACSEPGNCGCFSQDGGAAQVKVGIYVPHGDVPDARGFSPAIVAWNHATRLTRFGPLVFCGSEGDRPSQEIVQGIGIRRIVVGRLYRRLFQKWTQLDPVPLHRRVAAFVGASDIALWHAHQLEFPVADFRRAVGFPLPVIVHAHVTARRFDPARGVADRYVAVSEYVRHTLANSQGYPPERIEVIPNGVDTSIFRPAPEEEQAAVRDRLGIPREATVVLFAGRRQEIKGFDTFLAAADALVPRSGKLFSSAWGRNRGTQCENPASRCGNGCAKNSGAAADTLSWTRCRTLSWQQYFAPLTSSWHHLAPNPRAWS